MVSWREFVTELVDAVAWPVAVVVMLLVFRQHLAALLPHLESLEAPGFKARFRDKLNEIEHEARQLAQQQEGPHEVAAEEVIRRLAEVSPRGQILEAWLELEAVVVSSARDVGQREKLMRDEVARQDPVRSAWRLVKARMLDPEDVKLIADLRGLRNAVVHERTVVPSVEDAVHFSLAAQALVEKLNRQGC